jgi:hypothetical protein
VITARRRLGARIVAIALMSWSAFATTAVAARASPRIPEPVAQRLAALDCERVSASDVRDVLALVPAPRILLLQGSVAIVSMEPFGRFLAGMGYPEERLRNPADGRLTYDSFADSATLAGALAFDYEQTGLEPMLIGHSQGGMLAIRVLYELAGDFHASLHVVDPQTGTALPRTTIVDPRTGDERPVIGMHVSYAAALATGWLPRVLLGQWTMVNRLRRIPDTVTEFTGFDIPNDPIAGNLLGITPYEPMGSAHVRNVLLPANYSHIALPLADDLVSNAMARAWIDAWQPGTPQPAEAIDWRNAVHAADIWHSVKRHWCLQARRLLAISKS